jgi:hypothetical protein
LFFPQLCTHQENGKNVGNAKKKENLVEIKNKNKYLSKFFSKFFSKINPPRPPRKKKRKNQKKTDLNASTNYLLSSHLL